MNEVKPSPDHKMVKPLTFDHLFPKKKNNEILAKNHSGMMTIVTFSRQNDFGSRAHYLIIKN